MALTDLPNIGRELATKLEKAGIATPVDLESAGSVEALRRINRVATGGCLNMFYALEGAIRGVRWHVIPKEEKRALKAVYDEHFGDLS